MPATTIQNGNRNMITKVTVPWTSDSSGDYTEDIVVPNGCVLRVVTDPEADTAAPTDNYDLTILDEQGMDVCGGLGADRDTANSEQFVPVIPTTTFPFAVGGTLTVTIAAAGDSKSGTVVIYIG